MKKLTTSVLAVVLSSSFAVVSAQTVKDTANTTDIEGVVVTALGIKREQKAIGYAAQEIKGDLITASRQTNAISSLSGNVAGVQVTASSASLGGSTRITLRGVGSITGDNRPLIVVDGIPFNNSNFNTGNTARGAGGVDYGDTSADINPDDIESIVVLKGGPAAALYGARAIHGAIVYTTKRGKGGKTQIILNSGVSFDQVYKMPNLQRQYGQGSQDTFSTANINGQTYNVAEYAVDESWGPKYDSNLTYLPWYAFDPEFSNDYLKAVPWVAPTHDVDSFFKTGVTYNNNISISRSFEKTGVRFSYSNVRTEGIFPNSKLNKNTLNLSVTSQLSDKLKMDVGLTYNLNDAFNRPEQGYGDNSVAQKFFQWGARSLDFSKLKDYKLANGQQRGWNRTSWDNATLKYSDNPYWTAYENYTTDKRQRVYGNATLTYNVTKDLYVVGNLLGDVYSFTNDTRVAIGSQAQSGYTVNKRNFSEYNYELRVHYDKKFGDFSVNSFDGTNMRQAKADLIAAQTNGGLVIPNFYNLNNGAAAATVTYTSNYKRVYSLYESVSLGYKDIFFVDATNRTDWSSSLPNKPYNYPSISGSIVFSSLVNAPWLNFAKIRGGWANISSDTDPYQLVNVYDVRIPFLGFPRYSNTDISKNPNLVSENKKTVELGLEARMFNNRFGIDLTLYDAKVTDQIIPLPIDGGTGAVQANINVGEMSNKGIELVLNGKILKSQDFSWDMTLNFAKNENKLVELSDTSKTLGLANAPFRVGVYAVEGMKYGQIYGTDYTYDNNGNKIIGANGYYTPTSTPVYLGSYLPDWNGGLRNTFRYKNITLSALIDRQKGGKYFSTSHMWGMYSGMLDKTADNGIRENGIVLPGVVLQTDGSYAPNTQVLDAYTYATNHYNVVDAANVFDASYWKLREVTLGYTLPKGILGDAISDVTITAFARNLFTWGLAWDIDPETASYSSNNVQGLEGGSLPSTRTYGLNVQFKF
ncbi:SusC/RagA family TonB-linked outer membrane protein [Epilithonimonas caeni]|uniref:SusC/RagA family TonB-linked outer membrane protein n=1 Tax=Epilithonimonas caeni TaxID=365343 RepID=UPI0003FF8D54|nr:SusC/RagA family TonB-linked outer membrane protein [Epilithonimonas caeni]